MLQPHSLATMLQPHPLATMLQSHPLATMLQPHPFATMLQHLATMLEPHLLATMPLLTWMGQSAPPPPTYPHALPHPQPQLTCHHATASTHLPPRVSPRLHGAVCAWNSQLVVIHQAILVGMMEGGGKGLVLVGMMEGGGKGLVLVSMMEGGARA